MAERRSRAPPPRRRTQGASARACRSARSHPVAPVRPRGVGGGGGGGGEGEGKGKEKEKRRGRTERDYWRPAAAGIGGRSGPVCGDSRFLPALPRGASPPLCWAPADISSALLHPPARLRLAGEGKRRNSREGKGGGKPTFHLHRETRVRGWMPCCGAESRAPAAPRTALGRPHQNPAIGPGSPRATIGALSAAAPCPLRAGWGAAVRPSPTLPAPCPLHPHPGDRGSGSAGAFRTLRARTGSAGIARDAVGIEAESAVFSPVMQLCSQLIPRAQNIFVIALGNERFLPSSRQGFMSDVWERNLERCYNCPSLSLRINMSRLSIRNDTSVKASFLL